MSEHDSEHEILEALADPLIAAGMRLATPEETQVLIDQAAAHVMEQEEAIRATPLARTVEGKPTVPNGPLPAMLHDLAEQIGAMVADVGDHSVAYGPNRDGYGKCVEVMWRAGYLAVEIVARELGVTGYQHGAATMELLAKLRGADGPLLVLELERALYPQTDLHGRLDEALTEIRPWLAEQAREKLAEQAAEELADGPRAHPNVLAHWRRLATETPS